MRNGFGKLVLGVMVAGFVLSGCRFKGVESFLTSTTPQPPIGQSNETWKGDEYARGGIAEASGGLNAETNYGKGARANTTAPVVPSYDQPAKGIGGQAPEYPVQAGPGYGHSNGPALQNSPSDAYSQTVRG